MITMKEKTGKKIDLFRIVNYIVLAVAIVTALYIMANGLGLIDSLDFGAGAYYYAYIPEFTKYTDGAWYATPIPMWALIVLFLAWGAVMYKFWGWLEKRQADK